MVAAVVATRIIVGCMLTQAEQIRVTGGVILKKRESQESNLSGNRARSTKIAVGIDRVEIVFNIEVTTKERAIFVEINRC